MNLHDEAAGSTSMVRCKPCGKVFQIYDRSIYGPGKKCPGCGFVHHGPGYNEEATYERVKI